jgi:hypothetical protein
LCYAFSEPLPLRYAFILSFLCALCVSAVQFLPHFGGSFPHSHHAMAEFAQRQRPLLFSPILWQYGGCSRINRHSGFANWWLFPCFPPSKSVAIMQN